VHPGHLELPEDVELVVGHVVQQGGTLDELPRPLGVEQRGRGAQVAAAHVAVAGEVGDPRLGGGDRGLRGLELGGGLLGGGLGGQQRLLGGQVGGARGLGLHAHPLEFGLGSGDEGGDPADLGGRLLLLALGGADLAVGGVAGGGRRRQRAADQHRTRQHADQRGPQQTAGGTARERPARAGARGRRSGRTALQHDVLPGEEGGRFRESTCGSVAVSSPATPATRGTTATLCQDRDVTPRSITDRHLRAKP
jgi:hypothetical protein